MQLTFKAIARSAGYYAYEIKPESGLWAWRESASHGSEHSSWHYSSEEAAYRNCCIKANLVQHTAAGDVIS